MKKLPTTVGECRRCPYFKPGPRCHYGPEVMFAGSEWHLFEGCKLPDAGGQREELEAENAELRNRIKEMEDDRARLITRIKGLKADSKDLGGEVVRFKWHNEKLTTSGQEFNALFNKSRGLATELEAENAELRNRIKEMEDDDSHEGQVAFANDQADAWRVKCAKQRESLAWYEAKFDKVREVLVDWESDIDHYPYGYTAKLTDCRDELRAALEGEEK